MSNKRNSTSLFSHPEGTVIHSTSSSSLLSHTETSLKAQQSTLSHNSHSHTLSETHIMAHYHHQWLPQTRKSHNQTTTSPSTWTPHQQVATNTHRQFTSLAQLQKWDPLLKAHPSFKKSPIIHTDRGPNS